MNQPGNIVRYKMVLFGDSSVGKTSMVERFVNDKFEEEYISTLGYNVYEKQIAYNDNIIISLLIWDIGGQERFRELRKKYAEGAQVAFIVYDITNRQSFDNLGSWRRDLDEFAGAVSFIVIGNKTDLEMDRAVSRSEGEILASQLGALDFFETSAKTGAGVENAFIQLATATYDLRNR